MMWREVWGRRERRDRRKRTNLCCCLIRNETSDLRSPFREARLSQASVRNLVILPCFTINPAGIFFLFPQRIEIWLDGLSYEWEIWTEKGFWNGDSRNQNSSCPLLVGFLLRVHVPSLSEVFLLTLFFQSIMFSESSEAPEAQHLSADPSDTVWRRSFAYERGVIRIDFPSLIWTFILKVDSIHLICQSESKSNPPQSQLHSQLPRLSPPKTTRRVTQTTPRDWHLHFINLSTNLLIF